MSKRRKKKTAGMSDAAVQAMCEFGKEKYELATRVTRGVDSVGTLTFAQHCSSYAKDGFKKGYEYGKREERAKVFNIQERIKDFREEMRPICKKYGIDFLNSYVDMEFSSGTIKFKEQFVGSIHDMMEAYVNEMVAPIPK